MPAPLRVKLSCLEEETRLGITESELSALSNSKSSYDADVKCSR